MSVTSYELDREVFLLLKPGTPHLKIWQGVASNIADYVANWGVERFWAMSRSQALLGGQMPTAATGSDEERRYFAWGVARVVLCKIVGKDLGINETMTTDLFQERFRHLTFNQQLLVTDLLMEISSAIQFWTMRMKDAKESNTQP